jgi:Double-GTPase 2
MKTIICPFCFNKSKLSNLLFRCRNSRCSGRTEDKIYASYQGLLTAPVLGEVFTPSSSIFQKFAGQLPSKANCPTCKQETLKKICPTCHYELMYDVGATDEKIIAIIGGRSTGKSTYIATLINRLENEVGRNFKAAVNCKGDTTRERYTKDFRNPLYEDKRFINATDSATNNSIVKTPMVFRVTFNENNKPKAVNLVLFDSAGEDMQSLDVLSTEARYICYADALIFLVDPLQIPTVRQQLPTETLPVKLPKNEPGYIVERLLELHEKQFNLKPTDKLNKPVAFTLAKVDALYPIIDASSVLHHAGDHLGYFNLADSKSVHAEISAYMQNWLETNFSNTIDNHFKNYQFFGISSLGKTPINNQITTISSLRVEDPLLWIFHQFGLIKGRK